MRKILFTNKMKWNINNWILPLWGMLSRSGVSCHSVLLSWMCTVRNTEETTNNLNPRNQQWDTFKDQGRLYGMLMLWWYTLWGKCKSLLNLVKFLCLITFLITCCAFSCYDIIYSDEMSYVISKGHRGW